METSTVGTDCAELRSLKAHVLGLGADGKLSLARPEPLVEDFFRLGFAVVHCSAEFAGPVTHAMNEGSALLRRLQDDISSEDGGRLRPAANEKGLSLAYKLQGSLKQRLQIRRGATVSCAKSLATTAVAVCADAGDAFVPTGVPASVLSDTAVASASGVTSLRSSGKDSEIANDVEMMTGMLGLMEAVALACFDAWCSVAGVPFDDAVRRFCDAHLFPSQLDRGGEVEANSKCKQAGKGKSKSVLNFYKYFNADTCEDEPCREHADPGLVTVLCRSTNPALQVRLPRQPGGTPGRSAEYDAEWHEIESVMDACGSEIARKDTNVEACNHGLQLLVIVGETLERLSGARLASCRHRVVPASGPRMNIAYELRPNVNVWHPWEELEAASSVP
eukprot:TRINITY_DN71295_c0_g1_i1.p1 TRINITY_DN71295_c0_g1~~TRINITY_DN71295_c0_g1_i1.p1  ORF type:complete len:390 (+),score=67.49 TRINITY_DN71295_c0_g1_i1:173-1342(+)